MLNDQNSGSEPAGGSTAWVMTAGSPYSLVSLQVFKKQTPRHPSPHTQSSAVNSIQLSPGHSLCQILEERDRVRVRRCREPATVACRDRQGLLPGLGKSAVSSPGIQASPTCCDWSQTWGKWPPGLQGQGWGNTQVSFLTSVNLNFQYLLFWAKV